MESGKGQEEVRGEFPQSGETHAETSKKALLVFGDEDPRSDHETAYVAFISDPAAVPDAQKFDAQSDRIGNIFRRLNVSMDAAGQVMSQVIEEKEMRS